MKILLVDDSQGQIVFQKKILESLKKPDMTIDSARTGVEALKKTDEGEYKFIVCDINMPQMDGLEFVKVLRTKGNSTPVVMLTSESDKAKVNEAMTAGANDYLIKPVMPDKYLAIIKKYL